MDSYLCTTQKLNVDDHIIPYWALVFVASVSCLSSIGVVGSSGPGLAKSRRYLALEASQI